MKKENQEIADLEADILELLQITSSDFTLKDVKDLIYNEEDTGDMQKLIAMFDDGDPANLDNIIEIVTEAWNNFPHKALNGLSPMDKIAEYEKSNKK